MADRILLAFDGSEDSCRAAAWAGAVAAARGGAEVDIVHALTLPAIPVGGWEIPVGELLDRHEREMRALAERERVALEAAGVPAALFLRRWLPVDTLLEHAAERRVDLIVLGPHGHGLRRLRIGSISAAVAYAAAVPVVVVRGEPVAAPPGRVVVAMDGSPASDAAAAAVAHWFPAAQVTAMAERYRAMYGDIAVPASEVMPGAPEAVEAVRARGGRVIVVTAKSQRHAEATVEHLGLPVDEVVGGLFAAGKAVALREHGVGVYVGDHIADVDAARAAEAHSVAVATGPFDAAALRAHGADVVLDDLVAFPGWLGRHRPAA